MKYIAFWEFKPEDLDKVIEKSKLLQAEREKFPEKYSKWLFPPHSMGGETKGFTIVEGTPEQIMNAALFCMPILKAKYVPIFESEMTTSLWDEVKK